MSNALESVEGSRDGIRHGVIRFGSIRRRYHFDRLSGSVTLWKMLTGREENRPVEDRDPIKLRMARMMLLASVGGSRVSEQFGGGRKFRWRAPSRPREQPCAGCGSAASCGMDGAVWCVECAPVSFWPARSDDDPGEVI